MNIRVFAGALFAYFFNSGISYLPIAYLRNSYLQAYLGAKGNKTRVQMGCKFS